MNVTAPTPRKDNVPSPMVTAPTKDADILSVQSAFGFLDANFDKDIKVHDLLAVYSEAFGARGNIIDEEMISALNSIIERNKLASQMSAIEVVFEELSQFTQLLGSGLIKPISTVEELTHEQLEEFLEELMDIGFEPTTLPEEPTLVEEAEKRGAERELGPLHYEFWKQKFNPTFIKHLIAGGVAGAVSRTVVSPLERMKILFQVQGTEPASYQGVLPTLSRIWREEGLLGFLRGNGTNVIRIVPYSAVQFAAYEQFKRILIAPGKNELDTPRRLAAGACAGLTSVTCTYPLDIVRTRLSIQSATIGTHSQDVQAGVQRPPKLPGIWQTMVIIYKTEGGVFALYRGLVPTLLGVAPYVALNFHTYEMLRKYLTPPEELHPSVPRKLLCGALAGSIAQSITYPLDVLRRRMQVTGMATIGYKYKGTWDAAKSVITNEGIRGLYKGMVPNYLKVAPAIATSFVTYEWCKEILNAT
ncbi:uncharacterized protein VTP21DRAFT_6450 [Calcarisporiella thermophila]|uniref:uncharacterized protein n=1 Tax=Calcarisporiella thermophila TaxID=911321 RepID=UPI00374211CA